MMINEGSSFLFYKSKVADDLLFLDFVVLLFIKTKINTFIPNNSLIILSH